MFVLEPDWVVLWTEWDNPEEEYEPTGLLSVSGDFDWIMLAEGNEPII
jgi:hypothetical protein